jgi:hypothetical protein
VSSSLSAAAFTTGVLAPTAAPFANGLLFLDVSRRPGDADDGFPDVVLAAAIAVVVLES